MSSNSDYLNQLLQDVQHHDRSTRQSAESILNSLNDNPDAALIAYLQYAEDIARPSHLRQLALILLNQQILRKWQWQQLSTTSQEGMISFIFQGYLSHEAVIGNTCMISIAIVVSCCHEYQRNHIVSSLLSVLCMNDTHSIAIALKTVCYIVDQLDDYLLLDTIGKLYTTMLHIFNNIPRDASNRKILEYIAKVSRIMLEKVSNMMICGELDDDEVNIANNFTVLWCKTSIQWVHACIDLKSILTFMVTLYEIFQSLSVGVETFTDAFNESNLSTVMNTCWSILNIVKDSYMGEISACVGGSDAYDSDTSIDIKALVAQVLEVLCVGLNKLDDHQHRNTNTNCNSDVSTFYNNIDQLLVLLIEYMRLPRELLHQWEFEPSAFVFGEEDDECKGFSLRNRGAELIKDIVKNVKSKALCSILPIIHKEWLLYMNAPGSSTDGDMSHVIVLEGNLWALGAMGKVYMRYYNIYKEQCTKKAVHVSRKTHERLAVATEIVSALPPSDLMNFVGTIVQHLLQLPPNSSQLLAGRAAWLLSIYSDLFDVTVLSQAATTCIALLSPNYHLTTRFQACRALTGMLNRIASIPNHFTITHFHEIIQHSLLLLPLASTDTLHLPVELVCVLLSKFENSLSVDLAMCIANYCCTLLHLCLSDTLNLRLICDMIQRLVKTQRQVGLQACYERLVPHMHSLLMEKVTAAAGTDGCSVLTSSSTSTAISQLFVQLSNIGCSNNVDKNYIATTNYKLGILEILVSFMETSHKLPPVKHCLSAINQIVCQHQQLSTIFTTQQSAGLFVHTLMNRIKHLLLCMCSEGQDNYIYESAAPIAGIVIHIYFGFRSVVKDADLVDLLTCVLQCMQCTKSNYAKYNLCVGVIYIFARDSRDVTRVIQRIQESHAMYKDSLSFLINTWFYIHTSLPTKYFIQISTLGLIELLKLFTAVGSPLSNDVYAVSTLQLILTSLHALVDSVLDEKHTELTDADSLASINDHDDSDWDSSDDDDDSDGGSDGDVEIEVEDDDDGYCHTRNDSHQKSPFVSASLYLSDMIDSKENKISAGGGASDVYLANILTDDLIYSPSVMYDPLVRLDAQRMLADYFVASVDTSIDNNLPPWMSQLSSQERKIVRTLITS